MSVSALIIDILVLLLLNVNDSVGDEALPSTWAAEPIVVAGSKVREIVQMNQDGSIRQRRRVLVMQNKSPKPWDMDAGVCFIEKKAASIGCLPSFVIIGTMKAGTAELQGWLSQHPALYRWGGPSDSGAGEAHFFDKIRSDSDLESRWLKDYVLKGLSLPARAETIRNVYTFEKTPSYIAMPDENIDRMARMIPSARLIAMLREPASRAYSHFQHRCRNGAWYTIRADSPLAHTALANATYSKHHSKAEIAKRLQDIGFHASEDDIELAVYPCPPEMFESLVLKMPNGMYRHDGNINSDHSQLASILNRGFYAQELSRFQQHYPYQQMKILLTEELFHDFTGAMDRVQQWLGLPHFEYRTLTEINERGFTVLKTLKSKSNKASYLPMTQRTKAALKHFYQPWNEKLLSYFDNDGTRLNRFWHLAPDAEHHFEAEGDHDDK